MTISYNTVCKPLQRVQDRKLLRESLCVLTKKTSNTPVRGAGRGEGTFVIDRLFDMVHENSMDPADSRLRHLVLAEEVPHDTGIIDPDGVPMVLDSGDLPA